MLALAAPPTREERKFQTVLNYFGRRLGAKRGERYARYVALAQYAATICHDFAREKLSGGEGGRGDKYSREGGKEKKNKEEVTTEIESHRSFSPPSSLFLSL